MKPEYFILTGTGVIDLIDPEPHHFDFEEMVLILSRKPRFGGHGLRDRTPINVAQHSVYVSKHSDDPVIAMLMLLHDSQEVASGDVSSPVKAKLRSSDCHVVDEIECLSQSAILKMLKLTCGIDLPGMQDIADGALHTYYDIIHPVDTACASAEALYLFGEHRREEIIECFGMPTDKIEVTPMTQWESEQAFLNRFEYLRSKLESLQSTKATLTT